MNRTAGALRRYVDARSVLTLFLVLWAVPTTLTVTLIGAVGRPLILATLAMFAWWIAHQLQRPSSIPAGPQPVRWLLAAFVAAVLASYASAMLRGLPLAEISPADNGLLRLAGWCGVCLVAHDGLRDWDSLTSVIRRIVFAGGLMAVLGLMQFATKSSLLGWLTIPGMGGDGLGGVDERGGFVRAAGTAAHPLEYGVILCVTLPLALTLAMDDRGRGLMRRWWAAAAIAAAAVLSVSRSALIAVAVAVVVLAISWTRRQRTIAAVAGFGLLGLVYAAVPGMAGTLVGMFTGAAGDPSVASRVNSYDVAFSMVLRLPFFGRGLGTLLPSYVYLDNQYLGTVVELGIVGLASLLVLFLTAIWGPWQSRIHAPGHLESRLGAAVPAAICAGATSFTFFDALSFPLSAGLMFLMIGISGAYRRLARKGIGRHRLRAPRAGGDWTQALIHR